MSGRLATANLSANTITNVYTVPANKLASINVSVCNASGGSASIRLAISDTGNIQGADEFIEYDFQLSLNSAMERTGLILDAGKILTAHSFQSGVAVVVTGIEEIV